MLHTLNFEECQFFTRIQKHHRKTLQNFMLQECQLKLLIPSRKYQTLGNDYSATKKVCKRICPSKSRAITKFAIAQLKETVLLFWQTKQEQVLISDALLNHKPNQALAACRSWGNCSQQAVTTTDELEAFSEQLCERRPKLLRKQPPLS